MLRCAGNLDPKEAYESLAKMRLETYKGVGEERIEIAEQYFVQYLLNGKRAENDADL